MAEALSFALLLEDHFSANAKKSASALKELQTEFTASKQKLSHLQAQLSKAKTLGDIEGYRKYSALVADARKETFQLGDALTTLGPQAAEAGSAFGPLGIAIGAALTVATGLAAAFYELTKKGIETAFEVGEVNEKLLATFDALGVGGPNAGKKTLAMLDDLSRKLPQSRAQLAEWTKQYEAMGMTDLGQIRAQILATASAQAIMGDEGAHTYETITKKVQEAAEAHHGLKLAEKTLTQLYNAGLNVTDIADRMGMSTNELAKRLKAGTVNAEKFGQAMQASLIAKGKGPLEAMGNSLESIKAKAGEAFGHLFDGIDLSPVTDALKGFVGLLDQASPSGKAMHKGITGAIQGIVTWMGKMLVEGEVLFLSLELWAIKHKGTLKLVEKAFGLIGDAIVKVTAAVSDLFAKGPPKWLETLARVSLGVATLGGSEAVRGGYNIGQAIAPGHASGGLVMRPASGEMFASVAPGEFIMPKRETREMLGGGIGSMGRAMMAPANMNAGGGGGGPHIDHLEVHITAPHGVTDAASLTATGLALALERHQLAVGR